MLKPELLHLFPGPLEGALDTCQPLHFFSLVFELVSRSLFSRVPAAMRRSGCDIPEITLAGVYELSFNCLPLGHKLVAFNQGT